MFEHQKPKELSGMLVGIPVVNLHGFRRSSRYLPDRRDLNRAGIGKQVARVVVCDVGRVHAPDLGNRGHVVDAVTGINKVTSITLTEPAVDRMR